MLPILDAQSFWERGWLAHQLARWEGTERAPD